MFSFQFSFKLYIFPLTPFSLYTGIRSLLRKFHATNLQIIYRLSINNLRNTINLTIFHIDILVCFLELSIDISIILITILIGIGNIIYLRCVDDYHIIFVIVVGLVAEYISAISFMTLYAIFEKKVLEEFDLEKPLCIATERCKCADLLVCTKTLQYHFNNLCL